MKLFVAVCLLLFALNPVFGKDLAGVEIPDSLKVGEEVLVLNGAGLRTKTFLRIKVYVGALYLNSPQLSGLKIAQADATQVISMTFIYDGVSPEKLVASWDEGFETSTDGHLAALADRIRTFNGFFLKEAKKGDIYKFTYRPGKGVEVTINGDMKGIVPGLDFKQALWGIWLGEDPVDDDLKEGMLGESS